MPSPLQSLLKQFLEGYFTCMYLPFPLIVKNSFFLFLALLQWLRTSVQFSIGVLKVGIFALLFKASLACHPFPKAFPDPLLQNLPLLRLLFQKGLWRPLHVSTVGFNFFFFLSDFFHVSFPSSTEMFFIVRGDWWIGKIINWSRLKILLFYLFLM